MLVTLAGASVSTVVVVDDDKDVAVVVVVPEEALSTGVRGLRMGDGLRKLAERMMFTLGVPWIPMFLRELKLFDRNNPPPELA